MLTSNDVGFTLFDGEVSLRHQKKITFMSHVFYVPDSKKNAAGTEALNLNRKK